MRLSFDDYQKQSHLIIDKLIKNPHFIAAKKIGIYLSYRNEVDTWQIVDKYLNKKEIYVPVVDGKEMNFVLFDNKLEKNKYQIYEPINKQVVDKEELDLIIVPLVGFDKDNYRLGYGGGYYDRYLTSYTGYTIGLAYSFQFIDNYQKENFDIPLDQIITDI